MDQLKRHINCWTSPARVNLHHRSNFKLETQIICNTPRRIFLDFLGNFLTFLNLSPHLSSASSFCLIWAPSSCLWNSFVTLCNPLSDEVSRVLPSLVMVDRASPRPKVAAHVTGSFLPKLEREGGGEIHRYIFFLVP